MLYLILDTSNIDYANKLVSISDSYPDNLLLIPRLNINPSGTKALVTILDTDTQGLEWIDEADPIILASGNEWWAKNKMWDGWTAPSGNEWEYPAIT